MDVDDLALDARERVARKRRAEREKWSDHDLNHPTTTTKYHTNHGYGNNSSNTWEKSPVGWCVARVENGWGNVARDHVSLSLFPSPSTLPGSTTGVVPSAHVLWARMGPAGRGGGKIYSDHVSDNTRVPRREGFAGVVAACVGRGMGPRAAQMWTRWGGENGWEKRTTGKGKDPGAGDPGGLGAEGRSEGRSGGGSSVGEDGSGLEEVRWYARVTSPWGGFPMGSSEPEPEP